MADEISVQPQPDRWSRIQAAAIEHLALDEATLLDYCAELVANCDAYRLLAQQALHQLHSLRSRLVRQSETIARLHDLLRNGRSAA
jgi:hypothetical protein